MIKGIDVSNQQGLSINWKAVAEAGYKFVFIRATQGTEIRDAYFPSHWKRAKEAGLKRGAYHSIDLSKVVDPRKDADCFFDYVAEQGSLEQGDMIILDASTKNINAHRDCGNWCKEWLEIVEEYYKLTPIIHTSPGNINSLNLTVDGLRRFPLWLTTWISNWAQLKQEWVHQQEERVKQSNIVWDHMTFWQYNKGRIPGSESAIANLNVFNGTLEEFNSLGYQVDEKTINFAEDQLDNIVRATQKMGILINELSEQLGVIHSNTEQLIRLHRQK